MALRASQLYESLKKDDRFKGLPATADEFYKGLASDPERAKALHTALSNDERYAGIPKSFDEFSLGLGLKKKDGGTDGTEARLPVQPNKPALSWRDYINLQNKPEPSQIAPGAAGVQSSTTASPLGSQQQQTKTKDGFSLSVLEKYLESEIPYDPAGEIDRKNQEHNLIRGMNIADINSAYSHANESITNAFGDVYSPASKKFVGKDIMAANLMQSRLGKVNSYLNNVKSGQASYDDVMYLKSAAPKALAEVMATRGYTGMTDDEVRDFVVKNNSAVYAERLAVDGNQALSRQKNVNDLLAGIGLDTNKVADKKYLDDRINDIQQAKEKELQQLEAKYPVKYVGAGYGGYYQTRDNIQEYNKERAGIEQRYNGVTNAVASAHAYKFAQSKPNATVDQIGEEYLRIANPDVYAQWLKGGRKSETVGRAISEYGIQHMKATQNQEVLRRAVDEEDRIDDKYPQPAITETLHMIGAELRRNGNWAMNMWPTNEEVNKIAKSQLSDKNKAIYEKYIAPKVYQNGYRGNAPFLAFDLPVSGAMNQVFSGASQATEGITNTILGAVGVRSDEQRINEAMDEQYNTKYQRVGDYAPAKQELAALKEKQLASGLDVKELNRQRELERLVDTRDGFDKFIDGSFNFIGQVAPLIVATELGASVLGAGTEALGLSRAGEIAGNLTGMDAIAANATNFGVTANQLRNVAATVSGYVLSYDDAKKQALMMFPDDADSGKRAMFTQAVAGINALSERIFKDERVLDAFKKEVSPQVSKVVSALFDNKISADAVAPAFTKIMRDGLEIAKGTLSAANKEAIEETVVSTGTSIATAILAPTKFNFKNAFDDAVNTYTTVFTDGLLMAGFNGYRDLKVNRVAMPLLSNLGLDQTFTKSVHDEINRQELDKILTKEQASEKRQLVNTAEMVNKTILNTIPQFNGPDADKNGRIKSFGQLMYEKVLERQLDNTTDPVAREVIEGQIKESQDIRRKILGGELFVTDNFAAQTPEEANLVAKAADKGVTLIMPQDKNQNTPPTVTIEAKEPTFEEKQSGVSVRLPQQGEQRQVITVGNQPIAEETAPATTINMSLVSDRIPRYKELNAKYIDAVKAGDMDAVNNIREEVRSDMEARIRQVIPDANVKITNKDGAWEGGFEPSMAIEFKELTDDAIHAMTKIAQDFDQDAVHFIRPVQVSDMNRQVGVPDERGTVLTSVINTELKNPVSLSEFQKMLKENGLVAGQLSEDGKVVTLYNAYNGTQTPTESDAAFRAAIERFWNANRDNIERFNQSGAELRSYGRPEHAFRTYEQLDGDVQTSEQYRQRLSQPGEKPSSPWAKRVLNSGQRFLIDALEPVKYVRAEKEPLQRKIAADFDKMKANALNNPIVKEAYTALAKLVEQQFKNLPIRVYAWAEPVMVNGKVEWRPKEGEPYKGSADMVNDVEKNNQMKFYTTESGFGQQDVDYSGHPLLEKTDFYTNPVRVVDEQGKPVNNKDGSPMYASYPMNVNDAFRVVHDYFAHATTGSQFGAGGEEKAWMAHAATIINEPNMSDREKLMALWALTSETRGQNSWVNYSGKNDAVNAAFTEARKLEKEGKSEEAAKVRAEAGNITFADQKADLLPIQDMLGGVPEVDDFIKSKTTQFGLDKYIDKHPSLYDGTVADIDAKLKRWDIVRGDNKIVQDVLKTYKKRGAEELNDADYEIEQMDKAATDLSMDTIVEEAKSIIGEGYVNYFIDKIKNDKELPDATRNAISQSLLRQPLPNEIKNNIRQQVDRFLANNASGVFMIRRALKDGTAVTEEQNDTVMAAMGDTGKKMKDVQEALDSAMSTNTIPEEVQRMVAEEGPRLIHVELPKLQEANRKQRNVSEKPKKEPSIPSSRKDAIKARASQLSEKLKTEHGEGFMNKLKEEINKIGKKC